MAAPQHRVLLLASLPLLCAACGGGGGLSPAANVSTPPTSPDFSLSLSANSLALAQGAASVLTVFVSSQNGFSGNVQVAITNLPSGVGSNPAGPFTMAANSSTQVVLGASAAATPGNFTIIVQASSNSLSHSANLALTLQVSAAASLPRTTYVRTDSALSMDDSSNEPHHRHIAYDPTNKHIFVANRGMNRVEVFSSADQSRVAQIAVPGASSADLSADGASVWIGTVTEEAVAIDVSSLAVKSRTAISPLSPIPNSVFDRPEEIVPMSSGKILMRLRRSDSPEALLALWDPAANIVTNLTSAAPALFQNGLGPVARTGDHSRLFVAANDSSGAIAIFDANGNLVSGPITLGSGSVSFVAANSDGSRFAALLTPSSPGSRQLFLLDWVLNQAAPPIGTNAESVAFSRDGNFLYTNQSTASAPLITVVDGHTLQRIGQIPDPAIQSIHSELEDSDETQMLFAITNRGVAFIDGAKPLASLPNSVPSFAAAAVAQPSQGPITGGATVTISGQNLEFAVQFKFGPQLVASASVLSSTQIQARSPASLETNPVNLTAYFPSGWLALAPDAFSYGPQILEILPNAASKNGGNAIQILGYGFGTDPSQVTAKFGVAAGTVQSIDSIPALSASFALDSTYSFPLQRLSVLAPSNSPGPVNVTVTSSAGTATAARAFQFLQNFQLFPKPALYKFILYDQKRQWLYLSSTDHIDVFDLTSQTFHSTSLTAPGGPPPNSGLRGLTLTPDSSQLIAADFGAQNLYLINPDTAASSSVFVGGVAGFSASGPARVAATSTQTVFVALSGEGSAPPTGCSSCLSQLNLSATPPAIQPAPQPQISTLTGSPLIQSASAGANVFLAYDSSSGPLGLWSASAPNQFAISLAKESAVDLAASADLTSFATRTAAGTEIRSAGFTLTSIPAIAELEQIPARTLLPGMALHPTGALLYQPFLTGPAPAAPITNPSASNLQGGIDIVDTHTGRLRLRVFLPEPFAALSTDTDALHGSFLAINETGQRLFALTSSGLTVLQLASVPLSIGSVSPNSVPSAGGTTLTIHGSGFQSGVTVTINGKAVTPTFLDANSLTVTTPALSAGAQRLTITNPSGDTYTLDAAFKGN